MEGLPGSVGSVRDSGCILNKIDDCIDEFGGLTKIQGRREYWVWGEVVETKTIPASQPSTMYIAIVL